MRPARQKGMFQPIPRVHACVACEYCYPQDTELLCYGGAADPRRITVVFDLQAGRNDLPIGGLLCMISNAEKLSGMLV